LKREGDGPRRYGAGLDGEAYPFPLHREWYRPNFRYADGELTRPCLVKTSLTSTRAAQRQDEAPNAKKAKSAILRSYDDPIRSAKLPTGVNKIMTRFVMVDTPPQPQL
jgi:hypothetical protein